MGLLEADISAVFDPLNLAVIVLGSLVGLFFGAIPGIGAMVTVVLFLPVSFMLPPLPAIILLLAVYQTSEYGGCISSNLIGVPGSDSSVASLMDGYPMTRRGEPGKALAYSLYSSSIGAFIGGLVLLFLSVPMAAFALRMSYPEYFLIGLLGILAVSVISSDNLVRGVMSAALGLMVGTVGMDLLTGVPRFTAGRMELFDGFTIVAVIIGMFAFSELITMIRDKDSVKGDVKSMIISTSLSFREWKTTLKATAVGSAIGSMVGVFPGTGAGTSSWFGYSAAKKMSRTPKLFGKGAPEGIAGAESASNAAVGGAVVPLLALGIPGSGVIAIVMGAFIVHGIVPGPHIFETDPDLTYGILVGFLLTSFTLFVFGKLLTPLFVRVLKIPMEILIPVVLLLALVGIYASDSSFFELWVALCIGTVAFFLRNFGYSLPAFVIAFILSGIIEENFRRSLVVSGGSLEIFVTRPISLGIVVIISVLVIFGVWGAWRARSREASRVE